MQATTSSTTKNAAAFFKLTAVIISNPTFVAEHLSNFKLEAYSHRNCPSATKL
jgi:hypothetical protein